MVKRFGDSESIEFYTYDEPRYTSISGLSISTDQPFLPTRCESLLAVYFSFPLKPLNQVFTDLLG